MLRVYQDAILIPYAVEVDNQIISLYDPVVHQPIEHDDEDIDPRWIMCKRPCIVVGGELIPSMLELRLDEASGIYAAPLQMKANNGILIIDDFGRQLMSPRDLLNRWIVPLDRRVDYLTLRYGVKFQIPFELMVVFSTNLEPSDLADEAFLRRIHNKIYVEAVDAAAFDQIFARVVQARVTFRPSPTARNTSASCACAKAAPNCAPAIRPISATFCFHRPLRRPRPDHDQVRAGARRVAVFRQELSAKGAARTTSRVRNCFAPHSVLREFLRSPHRAGSALQTIRNSGRFRRVRLRCAGEFLKSAKGAARTTSRVGNCFAPHSVLREFLRSGAGLRPAIFLSPEVLRVPGREVGPLLRQIVEGEDRRDRADRHAGAAVDAFHRIDVEHRLRPRTWVFLLWVDAIDRASVHAGRVFHADTRFRNYVSHKNSQAGTPGRSNLSIRSIAEVRKTGW